MDITVKDQQGEHQTDKFFIDEPCVVSFFIGELGWLIQRWQGYLRHLKHDVYPDHKFFVMLNQQFHVLLHDTVSWTIDLPQEFYQLGLETDCYESPFPGTPAGSFTPPDVWTNLIEYIRQYYNIEKAVELWTPRGCNDWIDMQPQLFVKYTTEALIESNRPVITVFPRGRDRAAIRNVPEFVWHEVVEHLRRSFNVILCGTPSGACLVDYQAPGVDNLIGKADLEKVFHLLNNSVCSISSQSGPTHLSVLGMCPSYIIGHEQERHCVDDNRFNIPTSFRYVGDYRAIDAETIVSDVVDFISKLKEHDEFNSKSRRTIKPLTRRITSEERKDVTGVILHYNDMANIGNIVNLVDIDKLYLVGPSPEGEALDNLTQRLDEYDHHDKIHWISENAEDALDLVPNNLDFVYTDTFLSAKICQDWFYKLKAGGLFGSGNKKEWEKIGWPLCYRMGYTGIECDIESFYGADVGEGTGWFVRMGGLLRDSMKPLLKKNNLIGAEIGVFFGENSKSMLDNLSIKTLYLIDPYDEGLVGIKDPTAPKYIKEGAERLIGHGDRVCWIRETSAEAATKIPNKLDFIYIDGDHTYDGVSKDLALYWPKVKKNGILAGHDFDNEHVAKATKDFFEAQGDYTIFTALDDLQTVEFWVYKIERLPQKVIEDGVKEFNKLTKKRELNG